MRRAIIISLIVLVLLGSVLFFLLKPASQEQTEEISYPQTIKTSHGLIEKDYDKSIEKISLINADTKTSLAEITLNTPRINLVGAGYQKVAEIEFLAYEDFKQYLSNSYFELYDVRNNMKPIERQLDFKYWTTEMVEVEDYSYDCITIKTGENSSEQCTPKVTGTHLEERETWKDISEYAFKSGEPVRIGIFTEVQVRDKVEWIPTIYGVEIKEWAIWETSLKIGLVSWWTLDETTGTLAKDSLKLNSGTATSNYVFNTSITGIVNTSGDFRQSVGYPNVTVTSSSSLNITGSMTVSFWMKTPTTNRNILGKGSRTTSPNRGWFALVSEYNKLYFAVAQSNGASVGVTSTTSVNNSEWIHIVGVYVAGSRVEIWVNGVNERNTTTGIQAGQVGNNTYNLIFGDIDGLTNSHFNGTLDEIAIWNRSLTPTEIAILYNGGNGCTYPFVGLEVTLLSPADEAVFTTTSVDFSVNISDPGSFGIKNVSLLINGVINNTNTSTFEGIYNWGLSLSDGDYDWTVIAYDDFDILYEATNGTLDFSVNTAPIINVFSPELNENYTTSNIYVNATSSLDVDLWYLNYNGTNYTITINNTFNFLDGNNYNLLLYGRDAVTGVWGLNNTIYFTVDTTPPVIDVIFPNETIAFHEINTNLFLNWTVSDTNLDKCWYNWNGTNVTVTCGDEYAEINITDGTNLNLTFWANDTFGNEASDSVSWTYSAFVGTRTFNSTSAETAYETYAIDLITGPLFQTAELFFNGTEYLLTQSGSAWSYSRNIPLDMSGDHSFNFKITVDGSEYYTTNSTQTIYSTALVVLANATSCAAGYYPYYNITFRDEGNNTVLTSRNELTSGTYYIGTGTVNKTLTSSNSTQNPNYLLCFAPPNMSLTIKDFVFKYGATGYPIRTYSAETLSLTNSTTNKTLYLLSIADGIYTSISIVNTATSAIAGAKVVVERQFSGVWTVIGEDTTGSDGLATFWVNPNFQHRITATADGYDTEVVTITPTQSAYTMVLGGEAEEEYITPIPGVRWTARPRTGPISPGLYNFNVTVISEAANLLGCIFELVNTTGGVLNTTTETATNTTYCFASVEYNITAGEIVYGRLSLNTNTSDGFVVVNADWRWITMDIDKKAWRTITSFFEDLKDLNEFGDDTKAEFSRIMFFFIVLTLVIGLLIYYTGIEFTSPGVTIIVIWLITVIASAAGFLTYSSEGISTLGMEQYGFAIIFSMFVINYWLVQIRRSQE